MPFVFGDSYGGVQAAQQAATNSDRSFLTSLLAAHQAAQRMAMDQANQNQSLALNYNLRQQEMGQRANEFNAQLEQAERDRALREELGLGGLDVAEERLQGIQDMYDKRLAIAHREKEEQAQSAGPVLADRFAGLVQANQDANSNYVQAYNDLLQTDRERAAKEAQGLIRVKKGTKDAFEAASGDKAVQADAERLTGALKTKIAAFNEAKAAKSKAEQDFQQHLRMIVSSGFVPGNGQLVYPKTGQAFPITLPTGNSQKIRSYNPRTGKLE